MKQKKIIESGKRKTAVAKAVLIELDEKDKNKIPRVVVNGQDYKNLHPFNKLLIEEPLRIYDAVIGKDNFIVNIGVKGGGEKGQISAARLALAKVILKFTNSKELEKAFLGYDRHLLVADVRRKEAYKPGDSKARRKRQTSYR